MTELTWGNSASDWPSVGIESIGGNVESAPVQGRSETDLYHEFFDHFGGPRGSESDPEWSFFGNWSVNSSRLEFSDTGREGNHPAALIISYFNDEIILQWEYKIRIPSAAPKGDAGCAFHGDTFVVTKNGGSEIALIDDTSEVISVTPNRHCNGQWAIWRVTMGNSLTIETKAPGGSYSTDIDTSPPDPAEDSLLLVANYQNKLDVTYQVHFDWVYLRVRNPGVMITNQKVS